MSTESMFELASRTKLRFDTPKGQVSAEDLWDLPLTSESGRPNLDAIAIALSRQLRESAVTVSFVKPAASATTDTQLKFDVVKHVIDVRCKERDEEKAKGDRASKKQQLLDILARKENAELEGKSADELRTMINSL